MTTSTQTEAGQRLEAATAEYRRHLFESDCQACAGGHWCAELTRLDWIADAAAFESAAEGAAS